MERKDFSFLDIGHTDAMVWRDHDSDVNDPVPEDGFQASDVLLLTERVIDLRPVPSRLLCYGGLTTTWDFPGFCPIFKDTEGNVVTMSEYLCSRPGNKRKKTSVRRDGTGASEATSSPEPIRTINPNKPYVAVAETAESREDRSPRESPHGSADHSVHNYSDAHQGDGGAGTLQLETSGRAITHVDTEVVQPTPSPRNTFHSNAEAGESSRSSSLYVPDWSIIPQRCRLDTYLAPPAAQEESNALNNPTTLERAWFALARGALAQTDILERFETLRANFDELAESHAECGDWAGKLVQARLDVRHSSDLYNSLSDRFKAFRSEHEGCSGRLEASESRNRELSQANKDQALRIKELEDTLARKDSALPWVQTKLVRALQLGLQAGWGKGLAEERSKEDLLELMGRMKAFDVHVDTKMKVEYDKLFERQYPYVEKISRGFRHSVSDLLKVYPDSPPSGQAPPASAPNQPQD
ncbi:hypothetical protein Tco_0689884 [Tanacetum coccineum]